MKERPILFSAPMVRALIDGRKTQTRRVCKPQPIPNGFRDGERFSCHTDYLPPDAMLMRAGSKVNPYNATQDEWEALCPYGAPGDRLWVRETWMPDPPIDGSWSGDINWQDERRIDGVPAHYRKPEHCVFAASWDGPQLQWRPGIHMPRWASRLTLEVTEVRVERAQDISNTDAIAEGLIPVGGPNGQQMWAYSETTGGHFGDPCVAFQMLWHSINGAESWDANPWVWVVSFRRVEP